MGTPLHLVSAYLVARKHITIKIEKVITHRKSIPVTVEAAWRDYIITGGAL